MDPVVWFWLSVIVLAGMLFLPVSNLIWVVSVRRTQRKVNRTLSDNELSGQKKRARFLSFFLCIAFSFLFCLNTIGMPHNG